MEHASLQRCSEFGVLYLQYIHLYINFLLEGRYLTYQKKVIKILSLHQHSTGLRQSSPQAKKTSCHVCRNNALARRAGVPRMARARISPGHEYSNTDDSRCYYLAIAKSPGHGIMPSYPAMPGLALLITQG